MSFGFETSPRESLLFSIFSCFRQKRNLLAYRVINIYDDESVFLSVTKTNISRSVKAKKLFFLCRHKRSRNVSEQTTTRVLWIKQNKTPSLFEMKYLFHWKFSSMWTCDDFQEKKFIVCLFNNKSIFLFRWKNADFKLKAKNRKLSLKTATKALTKLFTMFKHCSLLEHKRTSPECEAFSLPFT